MEHWPCLQEWVVISYIVTLALEKVREASGPRGRPRLARDRDSPHTLPGGETSCTPQCRATCRWSRHGPRFRPLPPLLSEGSHAFCVRMNLKVQTKTQGKTDSGEW